jgi:rhodanese-related sulfurtransferase
LDFISNNIWLVLIALVSGGFLVWPWIAKRMSGAKEIGAMDAVQLINRKDAVVIDVREPNEFATAHIGNAKNIPLAQIEKRAAELQKLKNKPVLLACATGSRSHAAFALLKKLGFADVYVLSGGLGAWQQASLPVDKK